ncbi:glycosyltransferase [Thioclava pacifica]|uniref:Glycosyltransferase 2-like domain-containing protein n=1 Tax=Thioclava pacifica DSM 10166 TaxID=1353537 RepID=A0A074JFN4_9RHOB|nr:glycosyltransferase [Thioclava pacifica]KEO54393.1 hypothetical protein TP2_05560 [Thioclava pacifica DSM 10166]
MGRVTILMAVHEPGPDIADQLASISAQSHADWQLIVGDDSSGQSAREALDRFEAQGHKVHRHSGPKAGAGPNFQSLLIKTDPNSADFVAFSDQDDIWFPEKLAWALSELRDADGPALYCSRSLVTGAELQKSHPSPPRPRPLGFRNALVQNVAAGNTIVLNPAAARLAREAAAEAGPILKFDWWLYQLMSACDARLIHDDRPTLYYRQHGRNAEGENLSARARISRLSRFLQGEWRDWTEAQLAELAASRHRFTPENRSVFDDFVRMRQAPLPSRIVQFARLGLYRQSRAGTVAIWIGALFRLI